MKLTTEEQIATDALLSIGVNIPVNKLKELEYLLLLAQKMVDQHDIGLRGVRNDNSGDYMQCNSCLEKDNIKGYCSFDGHINDLTHDVNCDAKRLADGLDLYLNNKV